MAPESGNGRVTNKDLFTAITDLRKELKSDINDVQNDVSDLVEKRGELSSRVTRVETQQKNLTIAVRAWNIGNSVIAGTAALFAWIRTI